MKEVKRVFAYLGGYKLYAILAPIAMIVEVVMDILQPRLMENMVDIGVANRDMEYLKKTGILMIVVALVGLSGGVLCTLFTMRASIGAATDLRRDVYVKVQSFSGRNIDSFGIGKLITVLTNDIGAVQLAYTTMLRIVFRSPFMFIASIVMTVITAKKLSIVLVVIIPILLAIIFFVSKKGSYLLGKVQIKLDKLNDRIQENIVGSRVVRAYVRQDFEMKKFKEDNDSLTKTNIIAVQVISILLPIITLIMNMGIVVALWLGAVEVKAGNMEVGTIIAFTNYATQIFMALSLFGMIATQLARAVPSSARICEVLDTTPEIPSSAEKTGSMETILGNIEFRDVSFGYSSGETVLSKINFTAKQGEKVGIIGSTGSGKSTLVKLIPRLYEINSGEILIDGKNIGDINLKALRKSIGMILQRAVLFSGTIEENLKYGKDNATNEELINATKDACAFEFIDKFPDKLDHRLTQMATNLSGGQKQRTSIARAFVRKPSVLIFDDSTSAVDANSEKNIIKALNENYKGSTTFIIASKISSIMNCDKILVMDDGEIVAEDTHENLLKSSEIYKEIYISQGGKV